MYNVIKLEVYTPPVIKVPEGGLADQKPDCVPGSSPQCNNVEVTSRLP
jgi:hypothetical protein